MSCSSCLFKVTRTLVPFTHRDLIQAKLLYFIRPAVIPETWHRLSSASYATWTPRSNMRVTHRAVPRHLFRTRFLGHQYVLFLKLAHFAMATQVIELTVIGSSHLVWPQPRTARTDRSVRARAGPPTAWFYPPPFQLPILTCTSSQIFSSVQPERTSTSLMVSHVPRLFFTIGR